MRPDDFLRLTRAQPAGAPPVPTATGEAAPAPGGKSDPLALLAQRIARQVPRPQQGGDRR